MRPQQNRRMRGRGNNNNNNNQNRKGPNPLTRSYESNGPDVKIRGSAQQIAEKYTTLARDAQTSGDRVMAENYLQHAEHYNRIILVAQAQMPQQPARDNRDDDDSDDDDNNAAQNRNDQNRNDDGRNEDGRGDQARNDQNRGDDGRDDDNRGDRGRGNQNRNNQRRNDQNRADQQQEDRSNGSGPQPVIDGVPAEVALKQSAMADNSVQQDADANAAPSGDGEGADEAPRRPRRPRRSRAKAADTGEEQPTGEEPVTEAAQ